MKAASNTTENAIMKMARKTGVVRAVKSKRLAYIQNICENSAKAGS
jgi:hypothetical protein